MREWRILYIAMAMFLAQWEDSPAAPTDSVRSRRWYLPHYVPVQFAGNIGFLSGGLGYVTNSRNYELNLLYGYVPARIGGHRIHMVTVKNIFPILRIEQTGNRTLIPYLGLGLSIETGGNAFFVQPSAYPDSYYDFPKNVRLITAGGLKVRHLFSEEARSIRGVELFAEAGTIDVFLWYRLISSDISVRRMFSLAVGVNFLLDP